MTINHPRYVDEKTAAEMLSLSRQTLSNFRWQRRGPAYSKIGTTIRYRMDDLIQFMEAGRVEPEMGAVIKRSQRKQVV
jgi:hypothetical protein